jgi:hypothetical protein
MSASFVSIPVRTSFFQEDQLAAFNQNFRTYTPPGVKMSPFADVGRPLNLDEQRAFYTSKGRPPAAPIGCAVDAWA